jgi:hypothetical protein
MSDDGGIGSIKHHSVDNVIVLPPLREERFVFLKQFAHVDDLDSFRLGKL